mgnify:CR=1 FL=1
MQNQDQINLLLAKLESLLKRQESFSKETEALIEELLQLKATSATKKEEKSETDIVDAVEQENRNEESIREEAIKVHQVHTQRRIHKKLNRDVQNGVIGGVCAGVLALSCDAFATCATCFADVI